MGQHVQRCMWYMQRETCNVTARRAFVPANRQEAGRGARAPDARWASIGNRSMGLHRRDAA